ncbi:MAG: L-2-hydroxyglutarate oxidase LhgO [Myxococcota bacterium]|jgi:L-2-hydroxyglutarate oxidase LhgO
MKAPASDFDTAVIGAGVVGLAAAAQLASSGRSVVVLEARGGIAEVGTSRNSEVIHAGIYYPPQSLKAELCRRGSELLYERCRTRKVNHRRVGKLIVAARDDEVPRLEELRDVARANDVAEIYMIDGGELGRREPAVAGVGALFSPASGIVDAQGLCLSYLAEAEEGGASLLVRHRVIALEFDRGSWRVVAEDESSGGEQVVRCNEVVNAAGLDADRVASLAGVDVAAQGLRIHPCKGEYFSVASEAGLQLNHLVYPVGSAAGAGLGVHATLDLAGRIRFGPNAFYVDECDYAVDPGHAEDFAAAIRNYLPNMRAEWLSPDFAGIRAKLAGEGEGFRDFVIEEAAEEGLPGLVNCIGIESPGLTAAGAIAERVVRLLEANR